MNKNGLNKSSKSLTIYYCLFNDCFKVIKIFEVCNQHKFFLLVLKLRRTSSAIELFISCFYCALFRMVTICINNLTAKHCLIEGLSSDLTLQQNQGGTAAHMVCTGKLFQWGWWQIYMPMESFLCPKSIGAIDPIQPLWFDFTIHDPLEHMTNSLLAKWKNCNHQEP